MKTIRVLAIADEEDASLTAARLADLRPDLVVACGDLRFDYLDYVVSAANAPIAMVPGNHDPDLRAQPYDGEPAVPSWCTSVDGRVLLLGDLLVAGLGGSMRYRPGPNQYTEGEMRRRAALLEARARIRRGRRPVDLLLTHAPPRGVGDADDPCHRGFACFHRLVHRLAPAYLIHGHLHPYGMPAPDRRLGDTVVVNAVGHRVLELPGDGDGRR
jgi:Icc-related predicted phosphoesterase